MKEYSEQDLDSEFIALENKIKSRKTKGQIKKAWNQGRTLSEREEMIKTIELVACCFIGAIIILAGLYTAAYFTFNF